MPQGLISKVYENTSKTGKAWKAVIIDGTKYSAWDNLSILVEGNTVTFDAVTQGNFLNMKNAKVVGGNQGTQKTSNSGGSGSTSDSIESQSCLKAVVEARAKEQYCIETTMYETEYVFQQLQNIKNGDPVQPFLTGDATDMSSAIEDAQELFGGDAA